MIRWMGFARVHVPRGTLARTFRTFRVWERAYHGARVYLIP